MGMRCSAGHLFAPHASKKIDSTFGHLLDSLTRRVTAIGNHLLWFLPQPLLDAFYCRQQLRASLACRVTSTPTMMP